MNEKVAFIRVGPPIVIAKTDDVFTVQVTINGNPDSMWIDCYRHPTDYIDNESHPSRTVVKGNKIVFFSIESELEKNVRAMDNYLKEANECYRTKLVQVLALKNKDDRQKRMREEELDRVNEDIRDF
jgi:hypothetical protein